MPDTQGLRGLAVADYRCAADATQLEPLGDTGAGVCPRCGRRTDEPGQGYLGDGFDIVPRQWGLRGDPHAWQAMHDLVASTPTPARPDQVRQAYVAALRTVADVDVDTCQEAQVYRQHLDHGGMSGGTIDVGWWRTQGIPLLVERATVRRPHASIPNPTTSAGPGPSGAGPAQARPSGSRAKGLAVSIAVWAVVLAIPFALLGGGLFLLYQRTFGTHVQATVLECSSSGTIVVGASTYRTDCIAQWPDADGVLVTGPFIGGNGESDVGQTLDATVRDGAAYSRSLGLPLLLIVLGAPFLYFPIAAIRQRRRKSA